MLLYNVTHAEMILLAQYVKLMDLSVANIVRIQGLLPETDGKGVTLHDWQRRLLASDIHHTAFGTAWTNQEKYADELQENGYNVVQTNATWHYTAPRWTSVSELRVKIVRLMVKHGQYAPAALSAVVNGFSAQHGVEEVTYQLERLTRAYYAPLAKPEFDRENFRRGLKDRNAYMQRFYTHALFPESLLVVGVYASQEVSTEWMDDEMLDDYHADRVFFSDVLIDLYNGSKRGAFDCLCEIGQKWGSGYSELETAIAEMLTNMSIDLAQFTLVVEPK